MNNKPSDKLINTTLFIMEVNCLTHVLFCMYCLDHIEKQPVLFYIIATVGMFIYLLKGITNALSAARLLDETHDKKQ